MEERDIYIIVDREDDGREVYDIEVQDNEAQDRDFELSQMGHSSFEEAEQEMHNIIKNNPDIEFHICEHSLTKWWDDVAELKRRISILEADKKDLQQKLLIARNCAECLYCSNTECKNNIGIRK